MTTTLQIVASDLSTVLFDLNSPTGTGNPFSAVTKFGTDAAFELHPGDPEMVVISPSSRAGGSVISRRDTLGVARWGQRIITTSTDNYLGAIGELSRLLALGGVLKWTPEGSSQTRYIDFEPSVCPWILDGRSMGLWQITHLFELPSGVGISLTTQPYPRGAELDPAVNLLTNPTLLYDFGGTANRPDNWTWTSTTGLSGESISSTDEAYQFTKADPGPHNLEQTTANSTFAPGDVAVASFYARVTAVAGTPRMRAQVEFLTNAGASVGGPQAGTLTTLSTAWQRLTVTSAAAGATTGKVRVALISNNSDGTSVQVEIRNAQLEKTSLTTFRVPAEVVAADPASTAQPRRMLVYQSGDAQSAARVQAQADAQTLQRLTIYRESFDPVSYLKATLHKQAESGTLSGGTSSTADANASGGNTAQTVFSLLTPSFGTDSTFSGTTTSGRFTITAPTSIAENEVLVCLIEDMSTSATNPMTALPTGWKYHGFAGNAATASADSQMHVLTKVAGPSEPASYTFTVFSGGSPAVRAWIQRVSNVDTADPVQGIAYNGSTTAGTTATIKGLTTTRDNTGIIYGVGAAHASNTVNPISTPTGTTPTFTEQDDGNTGVVTSGGAFGTGVLATAGATGDKTATLNASGDWVAVMVALNPRVEPLAVRVTQTWTSIPAGTYDLWARVYPTAAAKVRIRPEWSHVASPTTYNAMPDYILDGTSWGAFEYVLVKLGRLSIPEEWPIDTLTVRISLGLEDYASVNFRIDWFDLVPANELMFQMEGTVVVASSEYLVGDGTLPKVFHLDSTQKLKPLGKASNLPIVDEPGFNLYTILVEQDRIVTGGEFKAKLSAAPTLKVTTTPRVRT